MRNISFSMTTPQFIDGSKDVTRRFGWWFLKKGDKLQAVEKAMGLKKGEKLKSLGIIEVVSVRKEPLNALTSDWHYGCDEMKREGFPHLDPDGFVDMLRKHYACNEDDDVNRIEFKRVTTPRDDGR